jgi:putative FmdB family regulatory protein
MPLYDYDCLACGRRFEVVHGVQVEGPTVCPICGKGPIRKAIVAPTIHFKGTGWAKKERRSTATPGTSRASGEESSAEGAAKADEASAPTGAAAASGARPADESTTSKAD